MGSSGSRLSVAILILVCGCIGEAADAGSALPVEVGSAFPPARAEAGEVVGEVASASEGLAALPWPERVALEQALAAATTRHLPHDADGVDAVDGTVAFDAAGATPHTVVSRNGARIDLLGTALTLRAVAIGRDGATAMRSLPAGAAPQMVEAQVRTDRGAGVVEWWRSLLSGLEHGLDLASRERGDGDLVVEIEVTGDLRPRASSDDAVELVDSSDTPLFRYAHLWAHDATGATIPARMTVRDGRIALVIADADASYPLVVDPLLYAVGEAVLHPTGPSNNLGEFVAMSADGMRAAIAERNGPVHFLSRPNGAWDVDAVFSTPNGATALGMSGDGLRVIVGELNDDTAAPNGGRATIYAYAGSSWSVESQLYASGAQTDDFLGGAAALSFDGSRAVVGAFWDDAPAVDGGSARVFVRTGVSWAEEATLAAADTLANDNLGYSVAISDDGSRAIVGADQDDTALGVNSGSARVFVRTGSVWTAEVTLLPTAAPGAVLGFGTSVAFSSDASRAIVGATTDTSGGANTGSARVFSRTGSAWAQETALFPAGGAAGDAFGRSVALTSDASRAIVGSPQDDTGAANAGTTRIFSRTGTTWTAEATLVAPDAAASDNLGRSVAISADGTIALAGRPSFDAPGDVDAGGALAFGRTGTTWTAAASLRGAGGSPGSEYYGLTLALSGDGAYALVGAFAADVPGANAGSVRAFRRSGNAWLHPVALVPADLAAGDQLGMSVALSADGSRAILGAPFDDSPLADAGSARIFLRTGTTWAMEATLVAPDAVAADYLGWSVALSSDASVALVGAYGDDTPTNGAGSARVFRRTGTVWAHSATLVMTGGAIADQLGYTVGLSADGTRALVGAPYDDTVAGSNAGSAVVFLYSAPTWAQEAQLLASPAAANDRFSIALSLSGDGLRALCGSRWMSVGSFSGAGSATVFSRSGVVWTLETTLTGAGPVANRYFASSLALSQTGSLAIVGVPGEDSADTDTGSARLFSRTGTTWTEDIALVHPTAAPFDEFGGAVALSSTGDRALVGTAYDTVPGAASSAGSGHVFRVRATDSLGTACTVGAQCASGFCADGVCCNSACGGSSPTDCQACSAALTGGANGTCAALSVAVAPTVTCRASVGGCDPAEVCASGMTTCPANALSPALTACRAAAMGCDAIERCDGSSPACPIDVPLGSGISCRASAGACDTGETCDGSSYACPGDTRVPAGVVCRTAIDLCDAAEACDGVAATCPSDANLPVGTTCRLITGACDVTDVCTGSSTACPDAFASVLTSCGPGISGACDAVDHCSGTSADCIAVFAGAGSVCRVSTGGCDVAETCSGTGATCPSDGYQAVGAVCRPSGGPCDVVETCAGGTPACPADGHQPATAVCRPSVGGCDPDETCDGASNGCPANALAPPGAVCRAPAGTCDVAETCSGVSGACPSDVIASAGFTCRASIGTCDIAETCNGSTTACPGNTVLPASTVCRATAGACDPTEACDGASGACPADVRAPNGTVCGAAGGSCATPGVCDGSGASCPGAMPRPAGTVCAPAVAGNVCDVDDTCDGVTDACVVRFAASATICGPAPSGTCDVADRCAGTSADCVATLVAAGTVCRPSAGGCDLGEACTGAAPNCPSDTFEPPGTVCRAAVGTCDVAESCTGLAAACPSDARASASTVCRPAAGLCDRGERCDGFLPACPTDQIAPPGAVCRPQADLCDVAEVCAGIDVDCPADGFAFAGTSCRPSAGACDVAETCMGGSGACPANGFVLDGTICRMTVGACDPAEICNGASATCPGDVRSPLGTACGGTAAGSCSSAGVCDGFATSCPGATPRPAGTVCLPATAGNACDVDDTCDGVGDACVARFSAATTTCGGPPSGVCDAQDVCAGTSADCVPQYITGTECRAATGTCDVAESCSGAAPDCPTDALLSAGTACRPLAGGCDVEETCSGAGGACPGDVVAIGGTVCNAAPVGSECDLDDECDGVTTTCTERFAAATTVCGTAPADVCDAEDFCTGTSGDCSALFLSGVECRASAGTCDVADVCSGSSAACPPDALLSTGVSCRASSDTSCDPEEICDGIATSCPTDVTACTTDAGRADAGARDGGGGGLDGGDGGTATPLATAGCACRASAAPSGSTLGLLLGCGMTLRLARRRRRAD